MPRSGRGWCINSRACSERGLIVHLNGNGCLDVRDQPSQIVQPMIETPHLINALLISPVNGTGLPCSSNGRVIEKTDNTDAMTANNDCSARCRPGQILQRRMLSLQSKEGKNVKAPTSDRIQRMQHVDHARPYWERISRPRGPSGNAPVETLQNLCILGGRAVLTSMGRHSVSQVMAFASLSASPNVTNDD